MKKLAASILFALICLGGHAQTSKSAATSEETATVYGTVTAPLYFENREFRANKNVSMPGAIVQIFMQDGEKIDSLYTTTGHEGKFMFKNIRPQQVRLKVHMMGYVDHDCKYALESGTNAILITLKTKEMVLEEAKVVAQVELMKQVKDTTIYNAAAVNTQSDESAKAILEQLPGFKVSESSISVNGEKVSKAYVNGVLVFGDSPMTAVSSLKADEVKSIKVYEEMTAEDKHRGMKNGDKQTVLDIVTKEVILSVTQASVTGAAGADESGSFRGHGAAAVMFNSEMTSGMAAVKVGDIDPSTGVGVRFFSAQDITRVPLSGRPFTDRTMTHTIYLSGEKHFKNRDYGNSISANYQFGHVKSKTAMHALTDYFETASSPEMVYEDTTSNSSTQRIHTFNFTADLKDTPLKSFFINGNARITDNSTSSIASERITTSGVADDIYSRTTTWNGSNDLKSYVRMNWTDNDNEKFRPQIALSASYGKSSGNGWTLDTLASSHTRRQLKSDNVGDYYGAELTATIEKTLINDQDRTLKLNMDAFGSYDKHANMQMSYDFLDVTEPVIDIGSSYEYSWNAFKYGADAGLLYNSPKTSMRAELKVNEEINMDRDTYPTEASYDRKYLNVMPSFMFHHRGSAGNITTYIYTQTNTPSLEQTRDRISDANPLSLTGGNKDLKPSYAVNANTFFDIHLKRKSASLQVFFEPCVVFRSIITKSTYFNSDTVLPEWDNYVAKSGAMLHTFDNAPTPSYLLPLRAEFANRFGRRFAMTASPSWSLSYSPQYVGEELIGITSNKVNISIGTRWNDKKTKIAFIPAFGWNRNTNDSGLVQTEALTYSTALTAKRSMNDGKMYVSGSYSINGYDYISSVGTDNYTQNLYIGFGMYFFNKALQLTLIGGDLLSSGSNYTITESALSYSQTWRPTYGRYLILSATYQFRRKH